MAQRRPPRISAPFAGSSLGHGRIGPSTEERAGAIVTDNIKDFPGDLLPPNIDVIAPAAFIADSVGIDCSVARAALIEMLNRRRNPPMSFHALLATLEERYQLHEACELLRSADAET